MYGINVMVSLSADRQVSWPEIPGSAPPDAQHGGLRISSHYKFTVYILYNLIAGEAYNTQET